MGVDSGYAAKLGIGTASTVDQPLDFLSESLAVDEQFVDRAGIRGTRSHPIEVMRAGNRSVGGALMLQPNAQEWAYLLPWMLGTAASGTTYALAETVPERYVTADRVSKVHTYDGCKVNVGRVRGTQGAPLDLTLDLLGIDETQANSGTFPALTLDSATGPFMFSDGAVVIGGVTYQIKECEIVIDNKLDGDRFLNSRTRTAIVAQDREVMVNFSLPWGDAVAAYNSGVGGVAVTVTFTNGTVSLAFSFVKVVFPRKSPTVPGKQEIMLPLQGVAKSSGATKELVVTLDHTV
jgi:hypothetical protein